MGWSRKGKSFPDEGHARDAYNKLFCVQSSTWLKGDTYRLRREERCSVCPSMRFQASSFKSGLELLGRGEERNWQAKFPASLYIRTLVVGILSSRSSNVLLRIADEVWNYHDPAPIWTKLRTFNDIYYIRTKLTKLLTKYDDVR